MRHPILISDRAKTVFLNDAYDAAGFMTMALIPVLDDFMESTKPKHQLKKACKDLIRECEKLSGEHRANMVKNGEIQTSLGTSHNLEDVHNMTLAAYDKAIEFFSTRRSQDVLSIMALIERLEEDGVKMQDIELSYTPLNKESLVV